jgi:tetratricopeptide (TPR) repeat protein
MVKYAMAMAAALAAILFSFGAYAMVPDNAGMQMLERENYAGARAYFKSALQQRPQDATAAAGMATINLAQGENESGVDWAQKAVAWAPQNPQYRMLLGLAYGSYIREVNVFSQLGMAYKVRDAFQHAVRLDPQNAAARSGLAKYYIMAPGIAGGSIDKAHEQIAALQKIDPAAAAETHATLAEHNNDSTKAEAYLRQAAELDRSGNGNYWLGMFLIKQDRFADAIVAFEDGIHKSPSNSKNYYGVGNAAALGKIHIRDAIRDLHKYLTMPHDWQPGTPTYKVAHYHLAKLYGIAGDKANAQAQYQAALDIDARQKGS